MAAISAMLGFFLRTLIGAYQLVVSPLFGPSCRFAPSCSAYAIEAIGKHGPARGSWLAARRVARCHPWNAGGVDPVPETAPDTRTSRAG